MIAKVGQPVRWIGLDLGQAHDYSALGVIEQIGEDRPSLTVRHLHRWPLGTIYPMICEDVCKLMARPELARAATELVIDATGVGRAVVDMFFARGVRPVAVTITAGYDAQRVDPRRTLREEWRVPKRELVAALQVLLQSRRFAVAPGVAHADTLKAELLNFRSKINPDGHEALEAWRDGDHDDLVLAVAVASWYATQAAKVTRPRVRKPVVTRMELHV